MLELRNVTKRFSGLAAVDQVSFTAAPGEVTGYLGPNGSGKSTTMKMIAGLMEPSDGEIRFEGRPIRHNPMEFKQRMGYVPEDAHLYAHLSALEYLTMVGQLRDLPPKPAADRIDGMLRLLSLHGDRHAPISAYSKGMRQKVLLMSALLHDPELLILDEPFSGLDVNAAMILRSLLKALAGRQKMVLYSSHVLEVVEKVCNRVLILRKGQVVAHDSVARLREMMSESSLEGIFSQLTQPEDTDAIAQRILEVVAL